MPVSMQTALRLTGGRLGAHSCIHGQSALLIKQAVYASPQCSKTLAVPLTWRHLSTRAFSNSSHKQQVDAAIPPSCIKDSDALNIREDPFVYDGPLTTPFRRLKIFSLASISLSIGLSPFLFVIESHLPIYARFALAGLALGTSTLSTSLVAWAAKPYVTTMRRCRPNTAGSAEEVEMTTYTLFMSPMTTRVRHICSLKWRTHADVCSTSKGLRPVVPD